MRLTHFTDYALRLLIFAAEHEDRLVTIEEAARAHGISRAHLMKVASHLVRREFLHAVRGRAGGLRLARPPEAITIGAVLRATEPDFALVECFTPMERCAKVGSCALRGVLGGALGGFLAHVDGHTLADLISASSGVPPVQAG